MRGSSVIAMSEQTTPASVVHTLGELTKDLQKAVTLLRVADLDAVKKRHAAQMSESRAFVNGAGAMDLRRHQAKLDAEPEEDAAIVAEAGVRHLKAKIRELETRIDVGRTFGATVRAELRTLDYQGGA